MVARSTSGSSAASVAMPTAASQAIRTRSVIGPPDIAQPAANASRATDSMGCAVVQP
jgi:hypothetical protein